jgi:DNA modification methylase
MANGFKSGGRVKGVSRNKPKVAASVDTVVATPVAASVATAAGAAAPGGGVSFAKRARTREAADAGLRKYRMQRVDSLIAYERNPRTHSPAQVDLIAKLITEFGFTNPVLVDGKRGIIAGHGRVLAARKLGMAEVPTLELSHLNAAQRRAYVIADNKSAERAGWDDELLSLELGELRDVGFDLGLTGFDGSELDALFGGTDGLTDPDDVPEAPAVPVTVLGDVWLLGKHRLLCGDSTSPQHVAALMQGAEAAMCFTSPPYAQQRDYKGGAMPWDDLMQGVFGILPVSREAQVLVNLGMVHRDGEWMPYWDGWIEWMRTAGWRRFGWYVWDQGHGLPGDWNGRLAPSHEFVFHFNRVAERARKTKDKLPGNMRARRPSGGSLRGKDGVVRRIASPQACAQPTKIPDSVIRVMRHHGALETGVGSHPAVFPVGLASEMLTAFSDPGDVIYEPFSGSGTQLIAAEKNGRRCYAMEIVPEYVDVAALRWLQFTGQQATLESTGRTFAETEAARLQGAAPVAPQKAARVRAPRAKVAA